MKKNILFLSILVLVISVVSMIPALATQAQVSAEAIQAADLSQSGGSMGTVLCNILQFVTGPIGKGVASLAIIGVGVGFFSGKVSWSALIAVTLALATLFGSPAIIRVISGDKTGQFACGRGMDALS
ncbi:MAG: TrbC/VirB2 family protein [Rickettsiales bacterium]|jgi:type IV secretion system protein VirB2|nr:TrbC/VirB2 family protein [Rickettsiales bacterium]